MTLPAGVNLTDFTGFPLSDFGRTVSRTPITKSVDNITGRETLSKGTPENITAIALKVDVTWSQDEIAKLEGCDAYVMVSPSVTLNEQDYVTFDGDVYEVFKLTTIYASDTAFFKYGLLKLKE